VLTAVAALGSASLQCHCDWCVTLRAQVTPLFSRLGTESAQPLPGIRWHTSNSMLVTQLSDPALLLLDCPDAGYGGSDCQICKLGTFSTGTSREPCTVCPAGTTTLAPGATSDNFCKCPPGFGGADCGRCPANSWSNPLPVEGNEPGSVCEACPAGRVSPPGSTSINSCGKSAVWG
jgi:hypothetical protein